MKKVVSAIVSIMLLVSCSEEDPKPTKQPDLFVGSWNYVDSYVDIDLTLDFSVVKNGSDYIVNNIDLQYSEIPTSETLNYEVKLRDPYAAGDGFRLIQFIASWTTTCPNGLVCDKWIFINFNNTKIYQKGGAANRYAMSAETVTVLMINKEEVVLENQELTKKPL